MRTTIGIPKFQWYQNTYMKPESDVYCVKVIILLNKVIYFDLNGKVNSPYVCKIAEVKKVQYSKLL